MRQLWKIGKGNLKGSCTHITHICLSWFNSFSNPSYTIVVNALWMWFIQERAFGTQISGKILEPTLIAHFKLLGIFSKNTMPKLYFRPIYSESLGMICGHHNFFKAPSDSTVQSRQTTVYSKRLMKGCIITSLMIMYLSIQFFL